VHDYFRGAKDKHFTLSAFRLNFILDQIEPTKETSDSGFRKNHGRWHAFDLVVALTNVYPLLR